MLSTASSVTYAMFKFDPVYHRFVELKLPLKFFCSQIEFELCDRNNNRFIDYDFIIQISGEKRLALLTEIQKLKTGRSEGSTSGFKSCQGSLIIENFQLPLRTEYIFSMASKKDGGWSNP